MSSETDSHPSAGGVAPLTSRLLSDIAHVRHGFFTREGGVSTGIYAGLNTGLGSDDDRAAVLENRRRVAENLGVQADFLISPHQIHSRDVVAVEKPWKPGEGPKCDALVTATRGLALGVGAADCGPVLFADREAAVIGAAHSGWRGAFFDILSAVVEAMETLGAQRQSIVAVLGPTISHQSYEVGPEFVERFTDEDANFQSFFHPSARAGHAYFDLPAFIEFRAKAAGIGHFERFDLCTYQDSKRFFSYRRTTHNNEPDYGRLISAIALA